MDYFVQLPKPFQGAMPVDGKVQLMTHATWYYAEDYETVSITSVSTQAHPLGVWICTQVYLMEYTCDVTAWDTLARFAGYAGGGCTLNSYRPLMSMASSRTGVDGDLEECLIVSIDISKRTHDSVMYGVIYKPTYTGDWYRDVPYKLMCFGDP